MCSSDLAEAGIDKEFVQDNQSRSTRGVLRGLHFQKEHTQGKLVRVTKGEVFDVAVDCRPHSATFGKWVGVTLSEENKKMFYIPEGFAHGFLVLSDVAEFCYKCTDVYDPTSEGGIPYDDPTVNVQWPDCGCEHQKPFHIALNFATGDHHFSKYSNFCAAKGSCSLSFALVLCSCQIGEDENGANIYYVFTDNEWFDIRNDKIYASGTNGNRAIPVIEYLLRSRPLRFGKRTPDVRLSSMLQTYTLDFQTISKNHFHQATVLVRHHCR